MSRSLKFSLALSAAVAASALLSACEKQDAQQSKTQPAPIAEVAPQQSKSVVVYLLRNSPSPLWFISLRPVRPRSLLRFSRKPAMQTNLNSSL